jgi:hypothetical protein
MAAGVSVGRALQSGSVFRTDASVSLTVWPVKVARPVRISYSTTPNDQISARSAGGELEQIQLLLGHASVQTTEKYLGTRQNLVRAPNDAIQLNVEERSERNAQTKF